MTASIEPFPPGWRLHFLPRRAVAAVRPRSTNPTSSRHGGKCVSSKLCCEKSVLFTKCMPCSFLFADYEGRIAFTQTVQECTVHLAAFLTSEGIPTGLSNAVLRQFWPRSAPKYRSERLLLFCVSELEMLLCFGVVINPFPHFVSFE